MEAHAAREWERETRESVPRCIAGGLPARLRGGARGAMRAACRGFALAVVWFETVSSTNDLADRAAAAGAAARHGGGGRLPGERPRPDGAHVVLAARRRPVHFGGAAARAMSAASDCADVAAGSASAAARIAVTLTAGVALAEALRAATGLPVAIKWPNDLVVGPAKGLRHPRRGALDGRRLRHVILGYGINVLAAAYPPEIADRATSIEAELGRPVDRAAVFAESLACLAERLRELSAGGVRGDARPLAGACRRRASGPRWKSCGRGLDVGRRPPASTATARCW